jgi:hypothetical protein
LSQIFQPSNAPKVAKGPTPTAIQKVTPVRIVDDWKQPVNRSNGLALRDYHEYVTIKSPPSAFLPLPP